jgi:hypothetical protein
MSKAIDLRNVDPQDLIDSINEIYISKGRRSKYSMFYKIYFDKNDIKIFNSGSHMCIIGKSIISFSSFNSVYRKDTVHKLMEHLIDKKLRKLAYNV